MAGGRASKTIKDERSFEEGGLAVYYGSEDTDGCAVLAVTARGMYTPIEKKVGYQSAPTEARKAAQTALTQYLSNNNLIDNYFIALTDFTEQGVRYGKDCKFRLQMYVRPLEPMPLDSAEPFVRSVVVGARAAVSDAIGGFGFRISG